MPCRDMERVAEKRNFRIRVTRWQKLSRGRLRWARGTAMGEAGIGGYGARSPAMIPEAA